MAINPESFRSQLLERIQFNQQDIDALILLGALEFEYFHDSKKSIELLEKATLLDPKNSIAKFWLAKCLYQDYFDYDKAEKILREALSLEPNRPECLSLMSWIIRENNGSLAEAIQYVQKAIEIAQDWPMLRYQLTGLYLSMGDVEAAEEQIKICFKIFPIDPKKITNEVERYFENVVTGRTWTDMNKEFAYLLEDIKAAKLNRSGSS